MKYKGYKIEEVMVYTDGTSDFQLYPPHGEFGMLRPRTTLQEIIEEIEQERKPDLTDEIINLKLQCALAANLIKVYVDTMEVVFNDDPRQFSIEDWDNVIASCNFLNRVNNKRTYQDFINRIEKFISKP